MKKIIHTLNGLSASAMLFLSTTGLAQAINDGAGTTAVGTAPEPSMLALLGLGVVSALVIAKRRK